MSISSKKLLHQIDSPIDLRKFSISELPVICQELRQETIEIVSLTGGHLGAGLGVVELTVALHYVFNTPEDKLVWDIGHQSYPHKILTCRRELMTSLRQKNGLSGFTKRSESIYDSFIGGHGGTAISSALGMSIARDLQKQNHEVIAVIGDGSITAGMAYEAMNNAGALGSRLILILNDNKMSISPAVGAITTYLAKLISSKSYLSIRSRSKKLLNKMPQWLRKILKKFERNTKDLVNDGNFFEEMGFYYLGPIDGHNVEEVVTLLSNIKQDQSISKPVMLHIITEKGKGFNSVEHCQEKHHAVAKFNINTGVQQRSDNKVLTYTNVFAQTLIKLAYSDPKIVAITAAMPSGTGLNQFAEQFPNRMFDVGMAEQHAVTFAAGLACDGIKPFVALYSTFLQRAYDQVINDVALQKLPVRFIIDRAGFVGADGPTHSGSYDITYLSSLPNFIIMCPSNEAELALMMKTALEINDSPSAIRFPRGNAQGVNIPNNLESLEIGKANLIQKGKKLVVLSLGNRLYAAIKAAKMLKEKYFFDITIVDARFAKPLDHILFTSLAKSHEYLITLEEGSIGGFAAHVNNLLINYNIKIKNLFYPDIFLDQDTQDAMHDEAGLSGEKIFTAMEALISE
jgi:1-deoxy-D-xylulose-5-phosphate synthase